METTIMGYIGFRVYIYIYMGTLLGVPITRTIVVWGLHSGSLFRETTIYMYIYSEIASLQ